MTPEQISYLVFGTVLVLALVFDLGLLSKSSAVVSIQKALWQTIFWVLLALGFGIFVAYQNGHVAGIQYISAYLTEWSLSIDNIFVFILIFNFFGIREKNYARILLIGILMAILLRIIFILAGMVAIQRFEWLLYVFGALLIYTGIKMFTAKQDDEIDLEKNRVYKLIRRVVPLTPEYNEGRMTLIKDGRRFYTKTFVVVVMLATTDIIFALDSIPAVFIISQERLVVFTSNIFAVLGLRSLFFLLRGAVNKFSHLQQGIAVVLVFIGLKMLAEIVHLYLPVYVSLLAIVVCLGASMIYSVLVARKKPPSGQTH